MLIEPALEYSVDNTDAAVPDWSAQPIVGLIGRMADRQPDRVAVIGVGERLTYRNLLERALRLADRLSAVVEPGEPVAILLANGVGYPIALLAVLAAGCPVIALDRDYPRERNKAIIEHAGAKAIVLVAEDESPVAIPTIAFDVTDEPTGAAPYRPRSVLAPDAPAVVVYTSGSTGAPKGIVLSQRALLHRACQLIGTLHLGPDDRTLPLGSPCTIAGLLQTFEALLAGATLVKINMRTEGIGAVIDAIAREQITALFAPPALLRALCRMERVRDALVSLACVHPSGDVLLSADVELLDGLLPEGCRILTAYGLTEAPAICHGFLPRRGIEPGRVPVGCPLDGYDCVIVGDDGRPVQRGDPGELVVYSRYTALGEWRAGRVVPGSLRTDPIDPTRKVLRTGDLVRQHLDGTITVLGRKDRQVQVRGMRVEPYEIECALRRSPAIADAAVIPRADGSETTLTAFIVPALPGDTEAVRQARRQLAECLPSHMQPSRIRSVRSLPLLPGYKIDVEALHALDSSVSPPSAAFSGEVLVDNQVRQTVEKVWRRLLGPDSLLKGATFTGAGGDSLALLTFVFDLEMELRTQLPLTHFEDDMTAAEMAEVVGAALDDAVIAPVQSGTSPVVLLKPGDEHVPVFVATGLGAHAGEVRILGKYLAPGHPVFALQPAPLDHGEGQNPIAAFAAQYLGAITEIQRHGPYVLVGYSIGGLVLYEAARALHERGERIALLALLDSYPHHRFWPMRPRLGLAAERSRHRLRTARRPRAREILPFTASNVVRLIRDVTAVPPATEPTAMDWDAPSATLRQARRSLLTGLAHYRGEPYDGKVVFFRPEVRWLRKAPKDPRSVWRRLVSEIAVVTVPGTHHTMCSMHADALAAALNCSIDEALAKG